MTLDLRPRIAPLARSSILLIVACLAFPAAAPAQSATDELTTLAEENARRYLHSLASGVEAGLSSGYFETASSESGVAVRGGIHTSGSFIPEGGDRFEPVLPQEVTFRDRTFQDPFEIEGSRTATPTATGDGTGVTLTPRGDFEQAILRAGENPEDFEVTFPDGFDIPGVPLASIRATVGFPTGTAVTASALPKISLSDNVGSVSTLGLGVRQNVTRFLPNAPLDAAVAVSYQSLALGDIVNADGTSASLIVSRDLQAVTVFASGALEDSSIDVEYTFDNPEGVPGQPADGTTISYDDEGENSASLTGGVQFEVSVARLTVSYSLSDYDVLRAGLSVGS